jgi:hypothetical protein
VAGRVHPRIKQILRGVKAEAKLRREGIVRFNKRWRSWTIRMVRQQVLPREVVLTSDPALMDSEYLSTCAYKAACSGIKDTDLWKKYLVRLDCILDEISPLHFGYVMWGLGKVQFAGVSVAMHNRIAQRAIPLVPEMTSFGIMSTLWMLKRALIVPPNELMSTIAGRLMSEPEKFRPSDYIRICNILGFYGYGKNDAKFRDSISAAAMHKFDKEVFAQDFREALDHVALINLWNDEMRGYILERFRKIFITARPNHLLKAYKSAVAVRVLCPSAWSEHVSEKTRGFYTSLAVRHIPSASRDMSKFHREVSDALASDSLKVPHRNTFRWGPFWIDIGIEDEREDDKHTCIVLEKKTSFWANRSGEKTEKCRIEHELLSSIGWRVVHVNHKEWKTTKSAEARVELLARSIRL